MEFSAELVGQIEETTRAERGEREKREGGSESARSNERRREGGREGGRERGREREFAAML